MSNGVIVTGIMINGVNMTKGNPLAPLMTKIVMRAMIPNAKITPNPIETPLSVFLFLISSSLLNVS